MRSTELSDEELVSFPSQIMSALHTTFISIKTCICLQILMLQGVEQHFGLPLGTERQVPLPVPLVIVISGPSGVGKDAVIKVLMNEVYMNKCIVFPL